MADTYRTAAESDADRRRQLAMLAALGAWDRALRRDACGAWRIAGEDGHIYAGADGWTLYVACRSARHWTATKGRLAFCRVTQDGDDEGCLRLDALPTRPQAAAIRRALGIRKRRHVSEATLERLRRTGFRPALNEGFTPPEPRDGPGAGMDTGQGLTSPPEALP